MKQGRSAPLALALTGLLLAAAAAFLLLRGIPATQEAAAPVETDPPESRGPMALLPKPENQADVYDNLDTAIQQNHDAVAWLEVPGTGIHDIVMQGDDNDYYLRRNEDGDSDPYGCYFLDYECTLDGREDFSANTVIYGHSELTDDPDGKRFAQLFRFTDPDFARRHPYLYLSTPEGRFTFAVFAVFYTDVGFDYIQVDLSGDELSELAEAAAVLSIYDYDPVFGPEDRILTLSTCSVKYGSDGDQRFVVMGKLCPEGFTEKEEAVFTQNGRN